MSAGMIISEIFRKSEVVVLSGVVSNAVPLSRAANEAPPNKATMPSVAPVKKKICEGDWT